MFDQFEIVDISKCVIWENLECWNMLETLAKYGLLENRFLDSLGIWRIWTTGEVAKHVMLGSLDIWIICNFGTF